MKTRIDDTSGNIIGVLGIAVDMTEHKRAQKQIEYLSFRDALTGLYNRAFAEEECRRLDAGGQLPLSVIVADLDGLKLINEALGQQEGDRVLVQAGQIVQSACRSQDLVARWGGDEFLVLLPRTDEITAQVVCQAIAAASRTTSEIAASPISLGTATKTHAEEDMEAVVRRAEERMERHKLLRQKSARSGMLASLMRMLSAKTAETEAHALRLQELAVRLGQALGLSSSELDELSLLGALHDLGKVAIPETILTKMGPLSPEEWSVMKEHSQIGYRIARASPELTPIAPAIRSHHERWDGSGYPQGLRQAAIPLAARIIAIVDAFDVMTRGRPYKRAMREAEALAELRRSAGTQFDPTLVEVFARAVLGENVHPE